jgi:hypothetical protein
VTFRVTGAVCADADRGITLSAHAEVADDRMADALTEPLLFFFGHLRIVFLSESEPISTLLMI